MKKINFLNIMCALVLIAIIASLIYAFHELYIYRTVDNSIATETVTETTTATETITETATNWADEFEKSFRCSNAQYEEIAKDVNKNITTIEPVEHPDFN